MRVREIGEIFALTENLSTQGDIESFHYKSLDNQVQQFTIRASNLALPPCSIYPLFATVWLRRTFRKLRSRSNVASMMLSWLAGWRVRPSLDLVALAGWRWR
jgi:hypothetical protein